MIGLGLGLRWSKYFLQCLSQVVKNMALFFDQHYECPRYVLHLGALLEPIMLGIPTVT